MMFSNKFFDQVYLNWRDRPEGLKQKITSLWDDISHKMTRWGYNGSSRYNIACVSEKELLKEIIIKNYPTRKEFYFLDIGAGNFRLGKSIIEYLNQTGDLPSDIKVHVIGISGEPHADEVIECGRCVQYHFGSFQIENLFDEFKKRGLDFIQKIDVIVSRWTFRHLVDPLGTLLQAYALSRMNGFLLMDGFNFCVDSRPAQDGDDMVAQMHWLLQHIHVPFLVYPTKTDYVLEQFVIKKTHESCLIKLNYCQTGFKKYPDRQSESGVVTTFHQTFSQENNPCENNVTSSEKYLMEYHLYGDQDLFSELSSVIAFEHPCGKFCGSLFEEDDTPPQLSDEGVSTSNKSFGARAI